MWIEKLLGTDFYHLTGAFIFYSMIGWLVESIYMSFCNKKLTNRGFAKGPFCPIYGFGALAGYFMLRPLRFNYILMYFAGSFAATTFEFIVGKLMIRFLGDLWWDYNEKPFNYQGIICLESTIAWGFYGWIVVGFLHGKIMNTIDRVNPSIGMKLMGVILFMVVIDYMIQLAKVFHFDWKNKMVETYENFKARWN